MNDVMEQIKTLSATLDEETTHFHPTGRLLLLGSYESVFLKAVKRKADCWVLTVTSLNTPALRTRPW